MSVEENKALVRRLIEEGWNRADVGAIEACYATDYVNHDPDNPAADWPSLKEAYRGYFTAFPDAHNVIDDLIGEGDRVMTRWTARGTHRGEFFGIPATGKQVTYTATTTYRLAGGNIVEGWWNYDLFGILQQLGAIPAVAGPAAATA